MNLSSVGDQVTAGFEADDEITSLAVDVRGLTITFGERRKEPPALAAVSFTVRVGEAVGIVGESGCGKSTLSAAILGYVPPGGVAKGEVRVVGQRTLGEPERRLYGVRGKVVAYVPQSPQSSLTPSMRVGRQIGEAIRLHDSSVRGSAVARRVDELLDRVGLPVAAVRRYPHELSGGQQQRVVIAMAFACRPRVLVLDEPTTGLDVTTQAGILALLGDLQRASRVAIVFVSHDLAVVSDLCDRVVVMYAGHVVETGPTRALLSAARHPYTYGLVRSIPSLTRPPDRYRLRGMLQRRRLPAGCPFAPRCDFAEDVCWAERPPLVSAGAFQVACWHPMPDHAVRWVSDDSEHSAVAEVVDVGGAPLLEIDAVGARYGRERRFGSSKPDLVLRGISLSVGKGETVAVVGESGSGKSTLAKLICGMLRPAEGRMVFDGVDLPSGLRRPASVLRRIQLVPQSPDATLNPRHDIGYILARPIRVFFGASASEAKRRGEILLETVRLDLSYARRYPHEMSGGERQRVAIARALAAEPSLIICDEILSALDVSTQASILDLLRDLQVRLAVSYLFISHDLAVVRSISDRIVVLRRGSVCEVGTVDDIYHRPQQPYTQALLAAIPGQGEGRASTGTHL